jgi:molybdopterin/thiamine biosynthesis adenylyltransferase
MDPISQMVEPFVSPTLDVIAKIGDDCFVDLEEIKKFILNTWSYAKPSRVSLSAGSTNTMTIREILSFVPHVYESLNCLDDTHQRYLFNNAKLSISGQVNFTHSETMRSEGRIHVFIPPKAQEVSSIKSFFIQELRDSMNRSAADKDSIKTIVDALSLDPFIARGRAGSALYALSAEIARLLESDQWRVRSSIVLGEMSRSFVKVLNASPGWGAELASLVHFKIMTHNNAPIYSFTRIKE